MLSVKLRTPDNLYVRIPNETLIKTWVLTVPGFDTPTDLTVGIAYEDERREPASTLRKRTCCLEEPAGLADSVWPGLSIWCSYWVPKEKCLREKRHDGRDQENTGSGRH